MARTKKEGYTKRTYRLSEDLLAQIERVAAVERRTITAQMETFLWDGLRRYEKEKAEKHPGNSRPGERAA